MNSYKISRAISRLVKRGEHEFYEGCVFTPLGIVWVYSQGGKRPWTLLQIVKNGRVIERQIKKAYSARGLSIIAHRFIKEKNHDK
jgi:hypothetical protein